MERFLELWRESSIVQGLIALCVIVTTCYLYAVGRTVPDQLIAVLFAILGYYFGAKSSIQATRVERLIAKKGVPAE